MNDEKCGVLLVEDNPGDARLIEEMLKEVSRPSFTLTHVTDLRTGLERVREREFDAVLLDLSLPDSQGVDTVSTFADHHPDAAIIVLTGLHDEEVGVQSVRQGAQDYLVKDQVDSTLLARAIRYARERQALESRLKDALARLESELHVVAHLQSSLLPCGVPEIPGLQVETHYEPAHQAGGDYFDFFPLSDRRWGVLLADVSGRGAQAAVIMAMTRVITHHLSQMENPARVLADMNARLYESIPGRQFVTCCYGVVDMSESTFRFSAAGHEPPLHVSGSAAEGEYLTDEPRLALGIAPESTYENRSVKLSSGDTLVLYTDGVLHAESPDGERFGRERLRQTVAQTMPRSAGAVKGHLIDALNEHTADDARSDDIAFLVLHAD